MKYVGWDRKSSDAESEFLKKSLEDAIFLQYKGIVRV